ncbi:hypothetical protein BK674_17080 [Pseudomonas moraviensis]|uniref:Uncharacterized protein n=1 Tax=Pseudomonas moraviensis TaxID=321662 RepID=A0A423NLU2_9PSED|nr:pyocin S6 family toxin immunity protein [Pseudomonas moraviensis]RON99156.1 hypothetical protein BK674_17080 [Pseudomonas moraviensis]WPC27403.1 pyocin S6 family toxin immunity protein [Pseudomonas moraviensis]
MFLWISGFLPDDSEDDALQFELTVDSKSEHPILAVMGWPELSLSPDGEWLMTAEQTQRISEILGEQLPKELDLFIGVRG